MITPQRAAFPPMPTAPSQSRLTSKRTVQVTPMHRVSKLTLTALQLDAHPVFLQFLDRNVEQKFQTFVREEKQACLPQYMLSILVIAAVVCTTQLNTTETAIEAFLIWILSMSGVPPSSAASSVIRMSDSTFMGILGSFYLSASVITGFLWYRNSDFHFSRVRLDAVQLAILLYCHLVLTPLFVAIGAIMVTHMSLEMLLFKSAVVTGVVNAIGEGHVASLVFFELVVVVFCGLLLRLQFWYFCVLFLECVALVCVLTSTHLSPEVGTRVALFVILCSILCLVLWTTYDNERAWRGEFVSSCNLITENRRLSNQNIEMKEELSTKLNPQMHYEMGDILRVLCQLKVKMSQTEKRDVDRIITALVTKQDLYEVRIDPTMAEYEEEVQGWLHMMASKQTLPRRISRLNSSRHVSGSLGRRISAPTEVLPVASSRRFSQNVEAEGQEIVSAAVTKLLEPQLPSAHSTMARWLMNKIRNEFFIDIFYIDEHCSAPLQLVFVACVELNNCVDALSLNIGKVSEFAAAVESHYFKKNPYHNALHAAAVVADINFYLRRVNLEIDDTTFFVALVAAAAHDISHPGVTNGFLIATKSKLAITYSDDSVLERMHVAELYRILSLEKFDIFSHMATSVKTDIRKMIIGMVLATDLARHFTRISKLKSKQFGVSEEARGVQLSLIMETLLMLADLGHTAKPFDYHELWANRISEEFYLQGDAEERRGVPISPLCDRRQANLPKSQVSFLTVIATPLFEAAGQALSIDEYDVVLRDLRNNITVWQGRIEHDGNSSHNLNSTSGRAAEGRIGGMR